MNKTRVALSKLVMLLTAASLTYALSLSAAAAPGTTIVEVPIGVEAFSIDLYAEVTEPYAGIEFLLSINDESAMDFHSFESVLPGAIVPPITKTEGSGYYSVGFFAGSNAYSGGGRTLVGKLHFSNYKVDRTVTITIREMKVNRLDKDNKVVATSTYPLEAFEVKRVPTAPDIPKITYKVTFDLNGGDWAGGGAIEQLVPANANAHEPATTRAGYDFVGWDKDFSCVTSDMVVKAVWRSIGDPSCVVSFRLEGGTYGGGGALVQLVPKGGAATAPTTTKAGHTLSWDKDFSNVTQDMTVTAIWTSIPGGATGGGTVTGTATGEEIEDPGLPFGAAFPFTDVLEGNWFYDDVYYMWENELMNGTAATLFSPNDPVRRGMVVTVLYRMEGEPDVSGLENPFDDVADGMYYTDAVTWAADKGIVLGYNDSEYGPNDDVTREQLAAILFRYQGFMDKVPPDANEPIEFDDEGSISEFAAEPVSALVAQGIINGKENNMFDPKGNATRAEYAAMLNRYLLAIATEE